MTEAFNKLLDKLLGWLDTFVLMLPNLGVAILIGVLFFFIAKYGRKLVSTLMLKVTDSKAIVKLTSNIAVALISLAGLFIALSILHLDKTVTSILAGAGVVGLAVGLAFQSPILNMFSGIIMSVRKIVRIGDHIESNGYEGIVDKINLREVKLKLFTGESVTIPNKMIVQNPLKNFTVNCERRLDLGCGVSYNADLEEVEKIAINAISESEIQRDESKEVELMYHSFGGSSIDFNLRIWLNICDKHSYLKAQSQAIIAIKKAFDKNGIEIPYPIRTLDFPLKKELKDLKLISSDDLEDKKAS